MAENSEPLPAPATESPSGDSAVVAPQYEELRRKLTQRQLTMLAIGGAIGVGLFLGSTVTIRLAGPGVIVTYLIGAAIARSEVHTSELQSRRDLVCRLLLEKKKK